MTNQGPDGPIDTVLTSTVETTQGIRVTPEKISLDETGLKLDEQRLHDVNYSVECIDLGTFNVTFISHMVLSLATDIDPNEQNNIRSVSAELNCIASP